MSKVKEIGRLILHSQLENNASQANQTNVYPSGQPLPQTTDVMFWKKPWFSTVLAAIYILSPLDIMPDVPVIGFLDDIFLGIVIGLNWAQHSTEQTNQILSSFIGLIKWGLVVLGVIVVLLLAIFGALLVKIFQ